AAFDHHIAVSAENLVAELLDERESTAVDRVERVGVVAEQRAPVVIRAPCRRRQDERDATVARQLEGWRVVTAQRGAAVVAVDERKRRELGEVDAVLEEKNRLEAGIGQLHTAASSCSIAGA